jgi:hypothetical protein
LYRGSIIPEDSALPNMPAAQEQKSLKVFGRYMCWRRDLLELNHRPIVICWYLNGLPKLFCCRATKDDMICRFIRRMADITDRAFHNPLPC